MARLGCIADGSPYIVQVNYFIEGDFIYSHSLPGTKISALRTNSNACIQVDQIESALKWQSVIAFGRYEEVRDAAERARVLGILLKRFPMLTPVESALTTNGAPPQIIVFRINVERLTGVAER
jgi:nitroimidazol reductase NimA-like FMN-containing flavoprotein (pyridoxamine 5'-phosphate oxidase superfamily)